MKCGVLYKIAKSKCLEITILTNSHKVLTGTLEREGDVESSLLTGRALCVMGLLQKVLQSTRRGVRSVCYFYFLSWLRDWV
jgi:hypothetical protein